MSGPSVSSSTQDSGALVPLEFQPVSRRLVPVRMATTAIGDLVACLIIAAVAYFSPYPQVAWLIVVILALLPLELWWVATWVRSLGYLEREEDLLVCRGRLWRRVVAVPYGRMQLVDVSVGPLERLVGIATLQLHTAAAASDAVIPGLPSADAARLRDRLAARGEARLAGL